MTGAGSRSMVASRSSWAVAGKASSGQSRRVRRHLPEPRRRRAWRRSSVNTASRPDRRAASASSQRDAERSPWRRRSPRGKDNVVWSAAATAASRWRWSSWTRSARRASSPPAARRSSSGSRESSSRRGGNEPSAMPRTPAGRGRARSPSTRGRPARRRRNGRPAQGRLQLAVQRAAKHLYCRRGPPTASRPASRSRASSTRSAACCSSSGQRQRWRSSPR